jgi:predicted nucleotidyltransferase
VDAAGFELEIALKPSRPRSPLRESIDRNRVPLTRALRQLGATNIRLFGSVARGDDGPNSDVDLLVDLKSNVGLFALGEMSAEAERILGYSVDVVPANSLKPDLAERVLAEARPL